MEKKNQIEHTHDAALALKIGLLAVEAYHGGEKPFPGLVMPAEACDLIAADRLAQRLADADIARALKYAKGLGGERHKIFNQACDYIAEQIEHGARS